MTIDTRSFFVGIATVLGTLIVGFGGGVMMGGVFSGDTRTLNKVERQAAKEAAREIPPAAPTVIEAARSSVPVPVTMAPAQAAAPASDPTPATAQAAAQPKPEPHAQPQQPSPPPASQSQATAEVQPTLGPQKPVALVQPDNQVEPSQRLSRREEQRLRTQQRREERRARTAERRLLEQARREQRAAEMAKRQQEMDDDDDRPAFVRRERLFDLPFFRRF